MSIGTTSPNVGIKDGQNTAEVTKRRELLVSGDEIAQITVLMTELLRQSIKTNLLLMQAMGVNMDDSEIQLPHQ